MSVLAWVGLGMLLGILAQMYLKDQGQPMNLKSWLGIIKMIAPIVLAQTPLAPIMEEVVMGIGVAESMEGASGAEKLAHVQEIVQTAGKALNDQAGHEVVNVKDLHDASEGAVSAAVSIANLIHKQA